MNSYILLNIRICNQIIQKDFSLNIFYKIIHLNLYFMEANLKIILRKSYSGNTGKN